MTDKASTTHSSVFDDLGFKNTIENIADNIRKLYLSYESPWIIGYSGGKDSSAVLQLIWKALSSIPKRNVKHPVHVISTDTLVENPVVAIWVMRSLEKMRHASESLGLPFFPHRLTPELEDSFWVNLIGKGYPAPRPKFRWCTSRLKINPSNKFIHSIINQGGEAILALGMRKAESSMRSKSMKNIEQKHGRIQKFLSPNAHLPNSYVYTPIEDWRDDDVWQYLLENNKTPWGTKNEDLLEFYKGATKDRECPMAITTGTPSCGDSRFGCWVCTMVSQDRSMQAMIQNDEEKDWMLPLLEYRDSFNIKEDRDKRDFRRITGRVQLYKDRAIHGPYWQKERKNLLRRLLQVQKLVKEKKPKNLPDFEIISIDELNEIRRIWNREKDEIEDYVPDIYEDVLGEPFPYPKFDETAIFGRGELKILQDICGDDILHYQLVRGLISQEQKFRLMARRSGLFYGLEQTIRKHFYEDEKDATNREKYFQKKKKELAKRPEQIRLEDYIKPVNN
ncbi:3'-phosphoadenosine 5'-phosphosulfate sulfurtransferase DndC [Olavius algarvensis associated proteobacterium Delta 3]|nr:3'-phosphoadenosine 5'-phosphosulfate sulfurtransferase DndC [Olavius algarvensis associated proteobacterium Delta 3]